MAASVPETYFWASESICGGIEAQVAGRWPVFEVILIPDGAAGWKFGRSREAGAIAETSSSPTLTPGEKINMAINRKPVTRPEAGKSTEDTRLSIVFAKETLDGLAAWARAEGRSTQAQVRFLIEQALGVHEARMAMTRR